MNWELIEKAYQIKFTRKDGSFRPFNEVMDDFYLRFTPETTWRIMNTILNHGDVLFKDVLTHNL